MPPQTNNQYVPIQPLTPFDNKPRHNFITLIIIILLAILLIASLSFGFWAFAQMKDYKNNSDQKSSVAVENAKAEQEKLLKAQFAEQEKEPLKTYTGPAAQGSVKIVYPKTWSAYIIEQTTGSNIPVDGYFYPNFVPGPTSSNSKFNYSLRIQISTNNYQSELNIYKSFLTQGTLKATPFKPEAVSNSGTGIKLDGQFQMNKKGSMVILPLRDKILKLWTENDANLNDFNNFVLKNLSFSP